MNKNTLAQNLSSLNDIWTLKKINYSELNSESDFTGIKTPTLELQVSEMKIYGNDSCNNIFGNIEKLDGSSISFGKIGSTKMACPNIIVSTTFINALLEVKTYKRKGVYLYFYNGESVEILKFMKVD